VTSLKRFNSDEFSLAGQEKVDLLIQVTTWAGLTVYRFKYLDGFNILSFILL
jgi:hypothetical protein